MKRKGTRNTTQVTVDVSIDLAKRFREFASERGETLRQALEMAMLRHMAYPPKPPPIEPLPDSLPE